MRRLAVLLATLALIACGGDSTGPSNDPVGTWHLKSLNGVLPYTFPPSQGTIVTITGSTLTLSGNSTYSEIVNYTATSGASTISGTQTELGTWFAVNGSVTFNDQTDNVTYQGAVAGNTLTEINSGTTQVYTR